MILHADWKSMFHKTFFPAFKSTTDYGACCLITPYLDFELPDSKKTLTDEGYSYTGSDFHSVPKGLTRNGIQNGLKIILDIENYDYAYFPRGAQGIRAAVGHASDIEYISQNGFYIAAGNKNNSWKMVAKQIFLSATLILTYQDDKNTFYFRHRNIGCNDTYYIKHY